MQIRPQNHQKQLLKFQLNPKLIQRFKIFQSAYSDLIDNINAEADANVFIEIRQDDSLLKGIQTTGKPQYQSSESNDLISFKAARNEHQNLESYLLSQLPYLSLKPAQIPICEALIDGLDSMGYFPDYKTTRSSIVKSQSVTTKQVDVCLEILQHCEPEGVGARSLRECLMLQLKHHEFENEELILLLERVITNHLDDLAEKNFDGIAQACSIPLEGVLSLAEFIKHNLNPKPGSIFFREDDIPLIIPSFDITLDDTNTLRINNLEQSHGIQIGLSEHYLNLLNSPSTDKKTKDFLKEKFNKARDLQESIALRQEELEKLIRYLTEKQILFLQRGPDFLLPLPQKDVAIALGMKSSSVSRILSAKFCRSPQGLIPLKHFCPRNYYGYTKQKFKALLSEYLRANPKFSDQKMAGFLEKKGIKIARRTIAKYRKELQLKSSYYKGRSSE